MSGAGRREIFPLASRVQCVAVCPRMAGIFRDQCGLHCEHVEPEAIVFAAVATSASFWGRHFPFGGTCACRDRTKVSIFWVVLSLSDGF